MPKYCYNNAQVVYFFIPKIIKITFNSQEIANLFMRSGLFLFYLYIPTHNIKPENWVDIYPCFRCLKFDPHPTAERPK